MDIVLYAVLVFGGVAVAKYVAESLANSYAEGLREKTMRPCPECLAEIPKPARKCRHCGAAVDPLPLPPPRKPLEISGKQFALGVAIVVAMVATVAVLVSG